MKTKVIFKIEGKGGLRSPVAFFPEEPGTNSPYTCTCYAQLGQHASAHTVYASTLKRATPEQYEPLKKELERQGYELEVVRKFSQKHLATRKEKLQTR